MLSNTEKLPNEPILIIRLTIETLQQKGDLEEQIKKDVALLDSLDEPVHQILVFPEVDFDLDTVIMGANLATRGENPVFQHPNILSISCVTQQGLMALAAKGLKSDAFGNVKIQVFETLDDALAYVRALA